MRRTLALTPALLLLLAGCSTNEQVIEAPSPPAEATSPTPESPSDPPITDTNPEEDQKGQEPSPSPGEGFTVDLSTAESADDAMETNPDVASDLERQLLDGDWTDDTGEITLSGWPQTEEELAVVYAHVANAHHPGKDWNRDDASVRTQFLYNDQGQDITPFLVSDRPTNLQDEAWWSAADCDATPEIAWELQPRAGHDPGIRIAVEHRWISNSECDLTQPKHYTTYGLIIRDGHEHGLGIQQAGSERTNHTSETPSLFTQ